MCCLHWVLLMCYVLFSNKYTYIVGKLSCVCIYNRHNNVFTIYVLVIFLPIISAHSPPPFPKIFIFLKLIYYWLPICFVCGKFFILFLNYLISISPTWPQWRGKFSMGFWQNYPSDWSVIWDHIRQISLPTVRFNWLNRLKPF